MFGSELSSCECHSTRDNEAAELFPTFKFCADVEDPHVILRHHTDLQYVAGEMP